MGCSVGVAMSRRTTPVLWRLGRSLPTRRAAPTSAVEDSLAARERAVGLQPDQPFLLRPDGSADMDVLAFFTSSRFKLLSEQTQESYAKDLRMFLSFLESQERSWAQCTTEDIADYEPWRRRDRSNTNTGYGATASRDYVAQPVSRVPELLGSMLGTVVTALGTFPAKLVGDAQSLSLIHISEPTRPY